MKVILYMATSVNGYITNLDDDSDWVTDTDWLQLEKLSQASGVIVMGKRTYEIFGDDFPVEGVPNIVMTHDNQLFARKESPQVIFRTNRLPK